MKNHKMAIDEYREQISNYAKNFAVANTSVKGFEKRKRPVNPIDMFVEGNLAKRLWKLSDQFVFMKESFEDLNEWIGEFSKAVPLEAYDTGSLDSIQFLDWMTRNKTLSAEQFDMLTCHRSRIAIENFGRENRIAHVRFQDLLSNHDRLKSELGSNDSLSLHLNPLRVWARFQTRILLDDEADLPSTMIFFAVGIDIRTAILEPTGQELVAELEVESPTRLSRLKSRLCDMDSDELGDLVREMSEIGLIAFG